MNNKNVIGNVDTIAGLESAVLNGGDYETLFLYKNIKERHIYISGEIDPALANEVTDFIIEYNKDDMGTPVEERNPIKIFISTMGGYVTSGLQIIDAIENSVTPVYTINVSTCYSMGMNIAIAGHKRFAFKNASYLIHDGSTGIFESSGKVMDYMDFTKKTEAVLKKMILERTGIKEDEYDLCYRKEWYMYADEAKEKGLVDMIIGVDIGMEEIL